MKLTRQPMVLVAAIILWKVNLLGAQECSTAFFPGGALAQLNGVVRAIVVRQEASGPVVYAGGDFTTAGGVLVNHIAKYEQGQWSGLGAGIEDPVNAIAFYEDRLVAGTIVDRVTLSAGLVYRYNGAEWEVLSLGRKGSPGLWVSALAVYNGELYAGGTFQARVGSSYATGVIRFDGQQWHSMGSATPSAQVFDLLVHQGKLIAGGNFSVLGEGGIVSRVAAWDGSAWSQIGPRPDAPITLALEVYQGSLYAAGIDEFKRLEGDQWIYLGRFIPANFATTPVATMTVYEGKLIIGGSFSRAEDFPIEEGDLGNLAAYDGVRLAAMIGGVDGSLVPFAAHRVRALAGGGDGLLVGGNFARAGRESSPFIARAGCRCPADINGDGAVGSEDYLAFLDRFGSEDLYVDLNGDGVIDFSDYLEFLARYDAGC